MLHKIYQFFSVLLTILNYIMIKLGYGNPRERISRSSSCVVISLGFGDEGKGKIVDWLIKNIMLSLCVRFNGGPNAGHTIYINKTKIVTHQFPTGIVQGVPSLIGSNCVINPDKL